MSDYKVNGGIKASKVNLIGSDGKRVGDFDKNDAMNKAKEEGMDLVMVSDPDNQLPVCKIMDYGKYKYEQSKKNSVKKKSPSIKEMSFHLSTSEHDLATKVRKVRNFLEKNHKVKFGIYLKGRDARMKDEAKQSLVDCLQKFSDIAEYDEIKESGRFVFTFITPYSN